MRRSAKFGAGGVDRIVDRVVDVNAVVLKDSILKCYADGAFEPGKLHSYVIACKSIVRKDVIKRTMSGGIVFKADNVVCECAAMDRYHSSVERHGSYIVAGKTAVLHEDGGSSAESGASLPFE